MKIFRKKTGMLNGEMDSIIRSSRDRSKCLELIAEECKLMEAYRKDVDVFLDLDKADKKRDIHYKSKRKEAFQRLENGRRKLLIIGLLIEEFSEDTKNELNKIRERF